MPLAINITLYVLTKGVCLGRTGVENWVVGYHSRLSKGKPPIKKIPKRLRRLTVEEAALLQGFPINMKFHGSQSAAFRQIGNAVPPPMAAAVADMVKKLF